MSRPPHTSTCLWPQCGQGTSHFSRVESCHSASIRLCPLIVGELARNRLPFRKVDARRKASPMGSPSAPAECGIAVYLIAEHVADWTAGQSRRAVGARDGQVAARKLLVQERVVAHRDRASDTRPRSTGVSRSIGASRSFDQASPIASVGFEHQDRAGVEVYPLADEVIWGSPSSQIGSPTSARLA